MEGHVFGSFACVFACSLSLYLDVAKMEFEAEAMEMKGVCVLLIASLIGRGWKLLSPCLWATHYLTQKVRP